MLRQVTRIHKYHKNATKLSKNYEKYFFSQMLDEKKEVISKSDHICEWFLSMHTQNVYICTIRKINIFSLNTVDGEKSSLGEKKIC